MLHNPPERTLTPLAATGLNGTRVLVLAISLALSGCMNLQPNYQRPAAPVPGQWSQPLNEPGLADAGMDWKDFFVDARLRDTVRLALANNRDLRVAALDIEKARAQYRIQRADLFPSIEATATGSRARSSTRSSSYSAAGSAVSSEYSVELGISSYEVDLFGRIGSLEDAALETFLASEETRRSTQISLVAETASAWLTLAADQQRLQLARETFASQQKTLELVSGSHRLGAESGLSLAQAQSTLESARADVASYASQVEQDLNALNLLVGATLADDLLPGDEPLDSAVLVQVPAGLPSELLQRRPDVLAAEHTLKAANADIGAARAAFFPSLTLTAQAGTASNDLNGLFKSGSRTWTFSPSINLPIFNAGSNKASLTAAEVQKDIEVANYESAVQTAFREVADALSVRGHIGEQLSAQLAMTKATETSERLSLALYKQGSSSFLDVLEAQRSLYSAQQDLITLSLSEQNNRVTLYKAMGGGWQPQSQTSADASTDAGDHSQAQ